MEKKLFLSGNRSSAAIALLLFLVGFLGTGCDKLQDEFPELFPKDSKSLKSFRQVNLVANTSDEYNARRVDPKLVNPWGLAFSPTGIGWPAAEGTGLSFVYDAEGNELRGPVSIPSPSSPTGGHPTGVVFNGSASDFKLSNGNPARFIFAGVDGVISGWNSGDEAERVADESASAAYTGLAIASYEGTGYLYGANFRGREIEVYGPDFGEVSGMEFTDPNLPEGYAPFNIQNIGDKLYVTYAKVGSDGRDEAGVGNGYVSIFDLEGNFIKRFASRGHLNAPWGVAQAPDGFLRYKGKDSDYIHNAILVGNFGDGYINAYTADGKFIGQLREGGEPIEIEGLWAIMFPPATATNVDRQRLYFTAGPDEETHGVYGYLAK